MEPQISQPITPPEQPIIPPRPTPAPPVKSNNLLLISLVILAILLSLGTAAFISYQNVQQKKQVAQTTPTPPISLTPITDPTENWKTYIGSSFSFKYPPEMNSANCSISGPAKVGATNLICIGNPKTITQNTDKPFDGFSVYIQNLGQQNFKTYIENEKTLQLGWQNAMGNGQTTPGTESAISVAGKEVTVLQNYSWDSIERMYIEMSNNTVLIIAKHEESKGNFKTFDQILSTFKFTGLSTDTSNWKTYTYPIFTIKFPPDWSTTNSTNPLQFFNYVPGSIGGNYNPTSDKGKLKVEIYQNNTPDALENFLAQQKSFTVEARGNETDWQETKATIAGKEAIKVKTRNPGFSYYFKDASSNIIFSISFALDFDNYKELSDQILSTFKFLDQNSSTEPTAGQRVNCPATHQQVCPMICIQPPPYICGSNGKSYCNSCLACSGAGNLWYITQDTSCEKR